MRALRVSADIGVVDVEEEPTEEEEVEVDSSAARANASGLRRMPSLADSRETHDWTSQSPG